MNARGAGAAAGSLAPALSAFLDEAAGWSHAWGRHDSMLLVADWLATATGRDPGAAWRGRYRSLLGARRIIGRAGGKAALMDQGFAAVGCADRLADPNAVRIGDVGLVEVLTAQGRFEPVGAVFGGRTWTMQMTHGLLSAPLPAVAAWRPREAV